MIWTCRLTIPNSRRGRGRAPAVSSGPCRWGLPPSFSPRCSRRGLGRAPAVSSGPCRWALPPSFPPRCSRRGLRHVHLWEDGQQVGAMPMGPCLSPAAMWNKTLGPRMMTCPWREMVPMQAPPSFKGTARGHTRPKHCHPVGRSHRNMSPSLRHSQPHADALHGNRPRCPARLWAVRTPGNTSRKRHWLHTFLAVMW